MKEKLEIKKERIDFLFNFIRESDAIEGIYYNSNVLRMLIENGVKTGHTGAILFLESLSKNQTNQYLDNDSSACHKNLICHIQELIVRKQHLLGARKLLDEEVGRWRKCGVIVGGRYCPPWTEIPKLMEEFFQKTHWFQQNARFQESKRNIEMIADFHYQLLIIHPFSDGNGRTARAMSYFLLRQAMLAPFVFTNNDKHAKYYPCFSGTDSFQMRKYFLEKIELI